MNSEDPVHILIIEDNEADANLLRVGFSSVAASPADLTIATNGEVADALLNEVASGSRRVDLVLLDLNLPGKSGIEILRDMKSDPSLARIPVIVFTSSIAPGDIEHAYRLHANSYLQKPNDLQAFFDVITAIDTFWLKAATLPSVAGSPGGRG